MRYLMGVRTTVEMPIKAEREGEITSFLPFSSLQSSTSASHNQTNAEVCWQRRLGNAVCRDQPPAIENKA